MAIYQGMAAGMRRESIHFVLDQIIPHNWERLDQELLDDLVEGFYQVVMDVQNEELERLKEGYENLSIEEQRHLMEQIEDIRIKMLERATQEVYGKKLY